MTVLGQEKLEIKPEEGSRMHCLVQLWFSLKVW